MRSIAPAVSTRYASLDLWRGLACLSVLVYHASLYFIEVPPTRGLAADLLARLWLGVPLFFAISGYCIAAAADRVALQGTPLGTYFARRFRRIFPPYLAMLAGTIVLVVVGEALVPGLFADEVHGIRHPRELTLAQWVGNLTLTETWRWNLGGAGPGFLTGHAWTLSYEEQFYALVGGLLLVSRPRFWRHALLFTAGVAFVAYFGKGTRLPLGGTFADGRWLTFAAGMLTYWAIRYGTPARRRAAAAALFVVPLAIVLHPAWRARLVGGSASIQQELVVAHLFAALLIPLARADGWLMTRRALAPLRWAGDRCYSIYLVHWPVTKLVSHGAWLLGFQSAAETLAVTIPLSILLSLPVGAWFYRVVERRFMSTAPARAVPLARPEPALKRAG